MQFVTFITTFKETADALTHDGGEVRLTADRRTSLLPGDDTGQLGR